MLDYALIGVYAVIRLNAVVNFLQGYTLFFLFLLKNIDCGYSLELPRQGGSNEYYSQPMF